MNFALLRKFDPTKVNVGDTVYAENIWDEEFSLATFIAYSGIDGDNAIRRGDGNLYMAEDSALRLAPLAWVEEEPVYPGDVLWWKTKEVSGQGYPKFVVGNSVDEIDPSIIYGVSHLADGRTYGEKGDSGLYQNQLTWGDPNTPTRYECWVNFYKNGSTSLHVTEKQAKVWEAQNADSYIACVHVVHEVK